MHARGEVERKRVPHPTIERQVWGYRLAESTTAPDSPPVAQPGSAPRPEEVAGSNPAGRDPIKQASVEAESRTPVGGLGAEDAAPPSEPFPGGLLTGSGPTEAPPRVPGGGKGLTPASDGQQQPPVADAGREQPAGANAGQNRPEPLTVVQTLPRPPVPDVEQEIVQTELANLRRAEARAKVDLVKVRAQIAALEEYLA